MYIEVLVEIKSLDKSFTYHLNEIDNNIVGKRVLVPFGNQKLQGFVTNIVSKPLYETKEICEVIDDNPVLNTEQLKLGKYIKEKTLCNLISAYLSMLPTALKANHKKNVNKKYIEILSLNISYDEALKLVKNDKQKNIIDKLKENNIKKSEFKDSISSINTLIKNNIIKSDLIEEYRYKDNSKKEDIKHELTNDQINAIKEILESDKPILLYGVTGSGKTEVYMHVLEEIINSKKQAIVLVPEISLTPQFVDIFRSRFDRIAVLHSGLSDGEKYDEWRRIERGEVDIVIGARSAIFAPLSNIGAIIIDEEHSQTYKQENNPKYNVSDIALFRMQYHKCKLVFGSATPSIEDYTKAKIGLYKLVELNERINKNLPKVYLVDMKDEYKKGNTIISELLKNKIIEAISNNQQVMLLLNRRGYSTISSCKKCGYVHKCPNCDIPLIYHKTKNVARCHYCGYQTSKLFKCPECNSEDIKDSGMGTEKLVEYIESNIEGAKVVRMDVDTTRKKSAHSKIIHDFESQKYNILIGTQMISKGLDFPNVSVVGVINADQTLNIPDFRSAERTFELLTQVTGRAGRASIKGCSIIQGFNVDHYSIICASNHDYIGFYKKELSIREKLKYSPYYNLCLIKINSRDINECFLEGNKIVNYLKNNKDLIVLGPTVSNIPKINNIFNIQIIVKYKDTKVIKDNLKYINSLYVNSKVKVECDLSPIRI